MASASDTTSGADRRPRGLIGFDESVAGELFAFQREAFPQRRVDWVEPRWRWMFLASANRLGVQPMVWMYRGKDGVAAHQGAIAVKVQLGDEERVTGWFVETMVLEAVRGKAVGPMLVAKAKQDLPFNLSLGQTQQMREMQFGLGWVQLAPLPTYAYVIRGRAVVRGKVPAPLVWLAGPGLELAQWWRGRGARGGRGLSVAPVTRFDAQHDELWQGLRSDFPCAVVRDASYLNWKYCDQPGQTFERLEILESGKPVALGVFKLIEPDQNYQYCRAQIIELIAPPARQDVVWFLLRSLCHATQAAGADLVTMDLLHEKLEEAVRRAGFAPRAPTRFFLLSTESLPEQLRTLAVAPERWLLTGGDSDIDRPW